MIRVLCVGLKRGVAVFFALCVLSGAAHATYGHITLTKKTEGGDGTFTFTGTLVTKGSTDFGSLRTSSHQQSVTKSLLYGKYTVTEEGSRDFDFVSLVCSNGVKVSGKTAQIDLAVGAYVTCTYTNKKKTGSIKIIKKSIGGTGTFTVVATPTGGGGSALNFSVPTNITSGNDGSGNQTLEASAGSYTISESNLPSVWTLDSIDCGNRTATATVVAGQTTTCTVTNKKKAGSIKVTKKTEGGNGSFDFTSDIGGHASFPIQTNNLSGSASFDNVAAGTYSITESDPSSKGFDFKSLTCNGGSPSIVGRKATVTLAPGASLECTYTNTQKGSITLIKKADAAGDFKFFGSLVDADSAFGALTLAGSGQQSISAQLPAGITYEVTENIAASPNFNFTDLKCDGGGTTSDKKATINLAAGANVVCTYTNTRKKGVLKVRKTAIGGDDTFNFSVSTQPLFTLNNNGEHPFTLVTGDYTISETNIPKGWELKDASCSKGSSQLDRNTNTIKVSLTEGETVCTFTNFKKNDDKMGDVTKLFIHRRVDNLLSNEPDRARIVRRLDGTPEPLSLKDGGMKDGQSFGGAAGSFVPGGVSNPVRSDVARLNGRTDRESVDSIGTQKVSLSLAQAAAYSAASDEKKIADGLGLAAPYGYNSVALQPRFDVWVEGHLSSYTETLGGINREGDFKILYVGADYIIRPGLLIGALFQMDRTVEDVKNSDLWGQVRGSGWMAGPYAGAKLSDHLYFDARAAWGQSTNDIMLEDKTAGYRSGKFETDRWLASAGLTGNYQYGAFRVSPTLGLAYGSESADAYRNSLGQTVDKASATIGRLSFGPEFGYTTHLQNGWTVEPQLSLKGIWNFDDAPIQLSTGPVKAAEVRAQVEGGVMVRLPDGFSVRASGSYDGIGDKNLEVWTTKAWVNFPLN
jgi:hypothetical protein